MSRVVIFSFQGAMRGARRVIPIALGDWAPCAVLGVIAQQAGLSLLETLLLSGLVFAGTSEFIALSQWTTPLPVLTIVSTTFVINLRHLLMGAALSSWFTQLSPVKKYGSAFFMTDETWALTLHEIQAGETDRAFMLGSGLMLYIVGMSGVVIGFTGGRIVNDPARWGLDFAWVAALLALLAGFWRGKSDLLPWAIAGGVALVAARHTPGKWYILLGSIAGSVVGAMKDAR
jgi:predicted branched-subunit amino acid permease